VYLAYQSTKYILALFNINYAYFQFSRNALLWQIIAALIVPIITGLWPILKGTSITVREAIASYGIGGSFGNSKFDRIIERFGDLFLSAPYAMALGNTFRQKGRLLLTQSVLLLAGVMFMIIMSLSTSLNTTVDSILQKHRYDFIIAFNQDWRTVRLENIAYMHPDVKSMEPWYAHSASILKKGQRLKEAGIGTMLVGIPNGSDSFAPPKMVEGRWLHPDDNMAVVINIDTARKNDISVGEIITLDLGSLGDKEWTVVGLYQNLFKDSAELVEIYANFDAVMQASDKYDNSNHIRVRTYSSSGNQIMDTMYTVRKLFNDHDFETNFVKSFVQIREEIENQFLIVLAMLFLLAIIMSMVGGVGLMGALSISVVERTREIGVMRAIGARSSVILGMFVMEGVLQGIISWLIAIPVAYFIAPSIADMLGKAMFEATLQYHFNWNSTLIWLFIIIVVSILASVIPARKATEISVRESLAYA
jgi:putative ABC transport system permease protein